MPDHAEASAAQSPEGALKFVLAPYGSRGDVEPLLALGVALRSLGHEAVVCAPENFRDSADAAGLPFRPAGRDFRQIFDGHQSNRSVFLGSLQEAPAQFNALLTELDGADMLVGAALQFAAPSVAELAGIPYRYAIFSPMYLRSPTMPDFSPESRVLSVAERTEAWVREDQLDVGAASWLLARRRELGLAAPSSIHNYLLGTAPVIGAFDPVLAPAPSDGHAVDVTGAWTLESHGKLPEEVSGFLDRGEPPVYVGFGSMMHTDSAELFRSLAGPILDAGNRLVYGRGWADVPRARSDPRCLEVGDVPHSLLFGRMRAIIHHGGAGTTSAAAAAGIPQLIIPHLGDQFYHGNRVASLGLGPAAVPLRELTPTRLSQALEDLRTNPSYAQRASEFGSQMSERRGVRRAAEMLVRIARG